MVLESVSAALDKFSKILHTGFSWIFGKLGKAVGCWPWCTILLSVGLAAALSVMGFMKFEMESEPMELYVPISGNPARSDVEKIFTNHGFIPFEARVLVYPKQGGNPNILLSPKQSLGELMDIWDEILDDADDKPFSGFRIVCEKPKDGSPCKTTSILAAWDFNRTKLENDPDPLKTINSGPATDVYGSHWNISTVLGGIQRDRNRQIVGAAVFNNYYELGGGIDNQEALKFAKWWRMTHKQPISNRELRAKAKGLGISALGQDERITQAMETWEEEENSHLRARMTHFRAVQLESDKAIYKDMSWALLAILLVGTASSVVLMRNSWTHCKVHLVFVTFAAIIMALLTGFGCGLLAGYKFNVVVSAVPFIIIGLGVDDTFLIMGQYRRADPHCSPSDRVSATLAKAGPSIFVTSITALITFLITATSSIPALQAFGVFACFGVLFDLVFQVTFFLAFVAFEARREHKALFGVPRSTSSTLPVAVAEELYSNQKLSHLVTLGQREPARATALAGKVLQKPKRILGGGAFDDYAPSISSNFFGKHVPAVLLTKWGIISVFIAEALLLAGAIYGCTKVQTDFRYREWFAPKGSWIHDGMRLEHEYFFGKQEVIYVYTTEGSHFYNQEQIMKCVDEVKESPYMSKVMGIRSWYEDYTKWARQSHADLLDADGWAPTSPVFVSLVKQFLKSKQGRIYYDDVKFNKARTHVVSTKLIEGHTRNIKNAPDGIGMMLDLRKRSMNEAPDLSPVVYGEMFPHYEGLRILKEETMHNLGIIGAVVFGIVFAMLGKLTAALLVALMVGLTDVLLIGFMWYVGLTFNMVTSINIMLVVGIAVDYSVHVAHNFLVQIGTKKERVTAMLGAIGSEVLCGATTSGLAVLAFGFANTYVMQAFFKMLTALILFGAWHGLIVLPVLLMLMGPKPYQE